MNNRLIKIICVFKDAKLTVEIPRVFFYNYLEVWGSTENAMKIDRYRQTLTLESDIKLRRKFYLRNKDRFDRHQEIFGSVYLNHVARSNEEAEYYIQFALDHWLQEMENNRPEPIVMEVKEIRRARADPKVTVLEYAQED